MATPTKRRKTNNFKPSPQTVGSLDFFFGKQRKATSSNVRDEDSPKPESLPTTGSALQDVCAGDGERRAQNLTDEDLARKLQLEWDREDVGEADRVSPGGESLEKGPRDGATRDQNTFPYQGQEMEGNRFEEVKNKPRPEGRTKDTLSLQSAVETRDSVSSTIPFDDSPLAFDPSQYLPNLKDHWAKEGGDASYGLLTRCFILVNSTQSRIKIVDTLVNFVRTIIEGDPESLLPAVSVSKEAYP